MNTLNKGPIIIDCDPGVDDAMALLLAVQSNLNILGITSTYGNTTINNTTRNILTILQLLNKNIAVYRGGSQPIKGKPTIANSHGKNGLGGYQIKNVNQKPQQENATDFMIKQLKNQTPKTITLLCLGPCTNLAKVFLLNPELTNKLKKIIILGGVINEKGNISPYAEFNIYNDPYAFQQILKINCQKIIIPINICRQVIIKRNDISKIHNKKITNFIKQISNDYFQYYMEDKNYGQYQGAIMYDLLVIGYLLYPDLFTLIPGFIQVIIQKNRFYGQTKLDIQKSPNCLIVKKINANLIKKNILSSL